MTEELIRKYLTQRLDVPVLLEEPDKPPSSYIIMEKTGSGDGGAHVLNSALFIFQSYADSLYNAALLNKRLKNELWDMTELDEIVRCKCNSDYNFTDPDTHRYRYQAVFEITYYEE